MSRSCAMVGRMRHSAILIISWCIVALAVSARLGDAQDRITLTADLLFYGDNTEFRNPFREGETIFGTAGSLGAAVDVNSRVQIRLGAFGNVRFGSEQAFESVRPVITLAVRSRRSTFLIGTFPTFPVFAPIGPDRGGPHGLLPPLQRETLTFDRPYEAGLQWSSETARLRHEAWITWQRLNTPSHRERFDAGLSADIHLTRWVMLPVQLHIVHEGGQLHAEGPVADSAAVGTGLRLTRSSQRHGNISLEVLGLVSRYVPDRETPASTKSGAALFARAAIERSGWRGHTIFWRGNDFIKDEGDTNYQSIRRNGWTYRGIRDYAEAGITRRFQLAPSVALEASARLHRTERHYEYSYRVTAVAGLRAPVSWSPRPVAGK
jgi:hypothetical protein